ncbi:hypothetical protein [Persicitalea sp.]
MGVLSATVRLNLWVLKDRFCWEAAASDDSLYENSQFVKQLALGKYS